MNIFVSFLYKSGDIKGHWWLLFLVPLLCTGCGEAIFPTGPEPTARPLITILEPAIGSSRVAAFGQPVTTHVITSQPFKTIQGEVKYPAGGVAGSSSLPPAAPGMYYWSSYGVSFVATQSGVYSHEYLAVNEYGIDLANGLFTILLTHDFGPDGAPFEVCDEKECDDTTPPPSGIPGVTYNPEWLTPDPYLSDAVVATITEAEIHAIADEASVEFLEYTADQYGGVIEDWLLENGYLTSALDVQLGFSEQIDQYIAIIEHVDAAVVPGFSSNEQAVRFLTRLQSIYARKKSGVREQAWWQDGIDKQDYPEGYRRSKIMAYPNPASERVHMEWQGDNLQAPSVVRVYDVLGRLVHRAQVEKDALHYEWEIGTGVTPGRYFVSVQAGTRVITGSLTISR